MINDRLLVISTGQSRKSTNWIRTEMMWSEFVDKLRTPQRTAETIEQYLNMTKAQQGQLKDIGGFVGGTLNGTHRTKNVTGRDLVTLDLDNIASGETYNVLRTIDSLGAGYAVYSTRSHADFRPRLRVIMPLDRTVTADEYEPIARKLASYIGLQMCDPTTFEASRLMYWPACSRDSNYVFAAADKPFVSADGILNQYTDWHDVTVWPQVPGEATKAKALLAKQADPTSKEGIVGAFCREFNIYRAIETFIPHAYETTEHDDRLTYTGGSTVAGAVIYDGGNFLYSHHATDPCSGLLVNAFDLVRLHLYGDQDETAKAGTPPNKLPSYQAMKKLALGNEAVARDLNAHYAAKASDFFTSMDAADKQTPDKPSVDWMASAKLEYDQNTGRPKKTRDNIMKILQHDPLLTGKIAVDDFAVRGLALGALPWNPETERRLWTDTDDAGVAWYLENKFDITGREKIDGALLLVSEANKINEVKDYLTALEWDKTPRLDMVLSDYLGADDTPYTRAVARKSLTAAVARVMQPGCKYDYVPVFVGPQGIGKSTFLATLGKDWFSDSLQSFEGKEAAEMIQGVWINELGEMTGYTRSETNTIKQFLSKREDIYRQAYGRRTGRYPRKCVFFGTCNQFEFLKDLTGNRRFWPVDVGKHKPKKNIWEDLPGEVDQIWAEAVMRWRIGEPLYFESPEIENLARAEQEKHREANVKEGIIKGFLEQPVPKNYNSMDLAARRMFWSGNAHNVETVQRQKTCAAEIWCEAFGGNILLMKRADTLEINQILENLPGWRRNKSNRNYGYCGQQKGFERM